jgi:hypothetical protein
MCGGPLRKTCKRQFPLGPFVPQDKLKPIHGTGFMSEPFEAQDKLKHPPSLR